MADLNEQNAAGTVKLTGANSSGLETNFAAVDAQGGLLVAGEGTAGTPVGGVLSVQGVPSGTPMPVKPTDGTNAQSFTAAGEVKTQITQPIPAGTNAIGTVKAQLQDNAGTAITLGQKVAASSVPVVFASDQPLIPDVAPATQAITALDIVTNSLVGANGQTFYFGNPTTNSAVVFPVASIESATVEATLIGAGGTLVIEVSMDGGTFWFRPNVFQPGTQSYLNNFTLPFFAAVNTTGMTHLRVRAITSWTGNASIKVIESANSKLIAIAESLPPGTNSIGTVKAQLQDNAGTAITVGQKLKAASVPVVFASDQDPTTIVPLTNSSIVKAQLQDNAGTGLTSSLINSKQRLDVNTASESTDGATAPFQSMQVGGKDGSGNLQAIAVDTSGNQLSSSKIPLTPAAPATGSVGTSSASLVSANATRKGLIIINLSANRVSLNIVGGTAVLSSGITLLPGGSWYMDEFSFTVSAIFAIASAVSSTVSVQELS